MSSPSRNASETATATPDYRVPALERGLDVLELLAARRLPMTQAEIARALGRSPSELFRTLTILERRGYLSRDPLSGAYRPTMRLFELGQMHHPEEALLRAAEGPMRALTAATGDSCHLAVLDRGDLIVLAQEEAPARVRVSVAVGSTLPPLQGASGRVLLASLPPADLAPILATVPTSAVGTQAPAEFAAHLAEIRTRGWEAAHGETVPGLSDLSVPIVTGQTHTRAALAVTALPRDHDAWVAATLPPLRQAAAEIAAAAGLANLPPPD